MNITKLSFLLLILFPVSSSILAQGSSPTSNYYNWFDTIVGLENTSLSNGVEFIDFEKGEKGFSKFLYSGDFSRSEIQYDHQTYFDIPLKYNVFNDEVLIKINGESRTTILQLFKEKVHSFKVNNKHFKRIENRITEEDEDKLSGFYELLFDTSQIQIFKKHRKSQSREIRKRKLFFKYISKSPYFYLKFNNKFYTVKSKRDFISIFPDFKDEINDIRIKNSIRRNNPDAFILAYAKQINILLSKS